jgi:gentisate 1,2-dioxygenase
VYWNYQRDVRPYMLEAADVITAAEAHRRVLVLNNPVLKHGATHTLTCAIQLIAFRPRACPLSHGRAPRQRRFGERVPKIELGS